MANVRINENSWLNLTSLLEFKGKIFWDNTDLPVIDESADDEFVTLTRNQAERLDLLAFEKYGDSDLVWAILLANDMEHPNEATEGSVLRIPAKSTIDKLFDANKGSNI